MENNKLTAVDCLIEAVTDIIYNIPLDYMVQFRLVQAMEKAKELEKERLNATRMDDSKSLPSKDEVVNKGFNNANGSEYNRRNVLRDADDDLYYTGWMDCFDWLVMTVNNK